MYEKPYKIMLLGATKSGKTAFCMRLLNGEYKETTPTQGMSVQYYTLQKTSFMLMEPAGVGRSIQIIREFLPDVHAVLLFQNSENYEETDPEHSERWMKTIRRYNKKVPIFLVTTKSDLMSEDKFKLLPKIPYNELLINLGLISTKTDDDIVHIIRKIYTLIRPNWFIRMWRKF